MTKYTDELAKKICGYIAEGYSLRHIECLEDMPTKTTIMRWCNDKDEFCEQYARAKERQAEAFAEELLDIADDARNDWIEKENQRTGQTFIALNEEAIARSRVRIETRKWLMGKMKPKKYGDSTQIKHADADGGLLDFRKKSDDEVNARILEITDKIREGGAFKASRGEEDKRGEE